MKSNVILEREFRHNARNKKNLVDKGFRWSYYYKGYTYKFPVYKDKNKTTLECILVIGMDEDREDTLLKQVHVEVYDANDDTIYAPFYTYNSAYEDFIKKINKKILERCKRLGIAAYVKNAKRGR